MLALLKRLYHLGYMPVSASRPDELFVFPLGEELGFYYWDGGRLFCESFAAREEDELSQWYESLGRPRLQVCRQGQGDWLLCREQLERFCRREGAPLDK